MSTRANLRKLDLGIDEEKDVFLISINKKIRNNRKKIEQIDELAKKQREKVELNAEQQSKIKSKSEVLENIKYHENIKDMYYLAFKTAKEEGKLPQATGKTTEAETQEEAPVETIQPVAQETRQDTQVDVSRITGENLAKILNLVHVAQARQGSESDLESVYEFYTKIFTFSESDRFVKIGDKLTGSLGELESYINGADQPALRNITYRRLQEVVERVANSSTFRSQNAEVAVRQVKTAEPSAIGSELKRGQEETEQPVRASPTKNQAKLRSPEKETKVEEKTQEKEGSAKKDWGTFEDEEEVVEEEKEEGNWEGEGGRVTEPEEIPQVQEEKAFNPYEDFVEIKGRQKEKKGEQPTRGAGGNRPYRGGYRGGYKGPRNENAEGQQEGGEGGYRGGRGGYRGGYRGPRTENAEGQQEGQQEGGYRGGRGGYRGGYRGPRTENAEDQQEGQQEGGYRGGRGGYRGGYRGGNRGGFRGGNRSGNFERRNEEGVNRQDAPTTSS